MISLQKVGMAILDEQICIERNWFEFIGTSKKKIDEIVIRIVVYSNVKFGLLWNNQSVNCDVLYT